jgi:hypothetical protein
MLWRRGTFAQAETKKRTRSKLYEGTRAPRYQDARPAESMIP